MKQVATDHLKTLGESAGTQYIYDKPAPELLETFDSPFPDAGSEFGPYDNSIQIEVPEFTSLCPKTGQPDFAKIIITYTPDKKCVESKSLKLYMMSFRQHGEFHEACVSRIAQDLIRLLDPIRLRVVGEFTPRGGIPFWPSIAYVRQFREHSGT